jgi:hypothetical protein
MSKKIFLKVKPTLKSSIFTLQLYALKNGLVENGPLPTFFIYFGEKVFRNFLC